MLSSEANKKIATSFTPKRLAIVSQWLATVLRMPAATATLPHYSAEDVRNERLEVLIQWIIEKHMMDGGGHFFHFKSDCNNLGGCDDT